MPPIVSSLRANAFLVVGIAIAFAGILLLRIRPKPSHSDVVRLLGVLLQVFAFWSLYWHLKQLGVIEVSAFLLAGLPFVALLLFLSRSYILLGLGRVGKLKWKDFELEFGRAGQRLEEKILPTLDVDEMVITRKRGVGDLHREVAAAVRKLAWLPISRRVLYLRVDFGARREFGGVDAAALYLYLLVLREAGARVDARVAGMYLYSSAEDAHGYLGVVETADYLAAFERNFPSIRAVVDLERVNAFLKASLGDQPRGFYEEVFEGAVRALDADTSFTAFLPRILPTVRRTFIVQRQELARLDVHLEKWISEHVEYLGIVDGSSLIAVVSMNFVNREVAKSVARALFTVRGGRESNDAQRSPRDSRAAG